MKGRGLLGRWGPNHAVDPIVSRWQRDGKGEKVLMEGKPVLEFVAIKRKDTGDWAIPGVSVCAEVDYQFLIPRPLPSFLQLHNLE